MKIGTLLLKLAANWQQIGTLLGGSLPYKSTT
jgi:hypothetical protein